MSAYHWKSDHRFTVTRLKGGVFKATCRCGEQSGKGAYEEVEKWMTAHLKSIKTS